MKDFELNIIFLLSFIVFLASTSLLDSFSISTFFLLFLIAYYFKKYNIYISKNIIYLIAILAIAVSFLILQNILIQTLLILIIAKLFKQKTYKEYSEIFTLNIILFLTISFFIDFNIFIFFGIIIFELTIFYLFLSTYNNYDNLPNSLLKTLIIKSTIFMLLSSLLAVLIYQILPKFDRSKFYNYNKTKLGFSKIVNLGDTSLIQKNNQIALRVKMPQIKKNNLYFRGYVMNYFNGRRWINMQQAISEHNSTKILSNKNLIKQHFYIKPFSPIYIFGLDIPIKSDYENLILNNDFSMISSRVILNSIEYEVTSYIEANITQKLINKNDFLQIPRQLPQEVRIYANKFINSKNILKDIQKTFNSNFTYTLKNLPISNQPLKEFIKLKRGNCEYFASLASIILRLHGYPTRLVVGFYGGSYNTFGKFYTIYQKNAHAWLEVYINNSWIRFDPTPTLTNSSTQTRLKKSIKNSYEWISFYTHKLIIKLIEIKKAILSIFTVEIDIGTYSVQNNSFFHFIKQLFLYLFFSFIYLILIDCQYSPILFIKKYKISYEDKIIKLFQHQLSKYGYIKQKHQTLKEFISNIEDPNIKTKSITFINKFEQFYYKDKPINKKQFKQFKQIIKSINRKSH